MISKHSNDVVTLHKDIEMNVNDGMTASTHGVILAEKSVVQAVSGEMAACVKCGDNFCVFVLWSSCDNCR